MNIEAVEPKGRWGVREPAVEVVKVLSARVDALVLRFSCLVDPRLFDRLVVAKVEKASVVDVGGREFAVHSIGGRGQPVHLSNQDLHCFVGVRLHGDDEVLA